MMDKDVVYTHDSATGKDGILASATTWMELEGIMRSEVSEAEKDKYCMISLTCGI